MTPRECIHGPCDGLFVVWTKPTERVQVHPNGGVHVYCSVPGEHRTVYAYAGYDLSKRQMKESERGR